MHFVPAMLPPALAGGGFGCSRTQHLELTSVPIEIKGAFIPPRRGLSAAQEGAVNRQLLTTGAGNLHGAAVTQGQAVSGYEADAALIRIARVQEHFIAAVRVSKEPQERFRSIGRPTDPALLYVCPCGLQG